MESLDLLDDFADHVVSFVDRSLLKPLKVIADTANGMGGLVVPKVFERVPFDLDVMYGELDGTFPNHPADPIQPANQRDLQARVTATGADVGLAFDGDADRVFLVDETGDGLSGSTTTAILASGTTCRPSSVDRASRLIGCVATGKRRPPTRRGCSSPKPTPLRSTCVLRLIHGPVGANGATGTATRTGRYPIRSRCSGSASMSLRKVGALPRRWLRDIVALLAPPTTSAVGDRWCMPSRLRPATVTVTSSPEVDDSPTDELRLVLVMKDI